jgi:hypothetical protein
MKPRAYWVPNPGDTPIPIVDLPVSAELLRIGRPDAETTELTFATRNDDRYAPAPQREPFSAPYGPAHVERVHARSKAPESRAAWLSRASGVSRSVVDAYLVWAPIPPRCRRAIEEVIRVRGAA